MGLKKRTIQRLIIMCIENIWSYTGLDKARRNFLSKSSYNERRGVLAGKNLVGLAAGFLHAPGFTFCTHLKRTGFPKGLYSESRAVDSAYILDKQQQFTEPRIQEVVWLLDPSDDDLWILFTLEFERSFLDVSW